MDAEGLPLPSATAAEQIRFALAQLRTPNGHHLFEDICRESGTLTASQADGFSVGGTTGTITRARSWVIGNRDLLSQGVAQLRAWPDRSHEAQLHRQLTTLRHRGTRRASSVRDVIPSLVNTLRR
jgi:hypothetical protein